MYKNMIPADVAAHEPHPREQARCHGRLAEVAALERQLNEQQERYLELAADFEKFKERAVRERGSVPSPESESLVAENNQRAGCARMGER